MRTLDFTYYSDELASGVLDFTPYAIEGVDQGAVSVLLDGNGGTVRGTVYFMFTADNPFLDPVMQTVNPDAVWVDDPNYNITVNSTADEFTVEMPNCYYRGFKIGWQSGGLTSPGSFLKMDVHFKGPQS